MTQFHVEGRIEFHALLFVLRRSLCDKRNNIKLVDARAGQVCDGGLCFVSFGVRAAPTLSCGTLRGSDLCRAVRCGSELLGRTWGSSPQLGCKTVLGAYWTGLASRGSRGGHWLSQFRGYAVRSGWGLASCFGDSWSFWFPSSEALGFALTNCSRRRQFSSGGWASQVNGAGGFAC